MKNVLSLCLVTALLSLTPTLAQPAENESTPAAVDTKAPRAVPFRGKISVIDRIAKTITVEKRTFQVTAETKFMKAGKSATLDDAAVGEEIGGAYRTAADGKLVATSIRLGPKPDKADSVAAKKETK